MLDILASFLSEAATPELKDSIERAHTVFERIELPDYEDKFDELLMLDGDSGQPNTLQSIVALTRDCQDQILSEHLIFLDVDSELDMRTKLIEGLMLLPDYEDKASIAATLALDLNNEEVFAELLALVTEHNASEWLPVITGVSGTLFDRLRQIISVPYAERGSALAPAERAKRIDALVALGKICKREGFLVVSLIQSGADLGYLFTTYLAQLRGDFYLLNDETLAAELLAMCLASEDGYATPVATVQQHLEHITVDVDVSTKVMVAFNNLVLKLQQLKPTVTPQQV